MRSSSNLSAPPLTVSAPSPSARFLPRRRTIFLRDWILALVALGLILAAGLFRSERSDPTSKEPNAVAPQHV